MMWLDRGGLVRVIIRCQDTECGQSVTFRAYSRKRLMVWGEGVLFSDHDEAGNRKRFYTALRNLRRAWRGSIVGEHFNAQPILIQHASLKRWSDDSAFKVHCPRCTDGLLLVARDQHSFRLIREDRCITCAQRFVYVDAEIGGERLAEPAPPPADLPQATFHGIPFPFRMKP